MSEYLKMEIFKNENLEINIGDVFYHKADGRRIVVIDFGRPDNDMRLNARDKNKPVCRFYDDSSNDYNHKEFIYSELSREKLVL